MGGGGEERWEMVSKGIISYGLIVSMGVIIYISRGYNNNISIEVIII